MYMQPFHDGDVHATFRNILDEICAEIDSLDNQYVLKASPTELEEYFVEKATITPLVLHIDQQHIERQRTIQVDVSRDFRRSIMPGERATVLGTELEIAISYEGESNLWKIRASTCSLGGYPKIDMLPDRIVFKVSFPDDSASPQQLKSRVEEVTRSFAEAVNHQRGDVEQHNKTAPKRIKERLDYKRKKALDASGAVAALGIPIRQRDQPATYTIPTKRRETHINRPTVATEPYVSEPILDQEQYEHILGILRSMALVIERNPSSFSSLDEEAIRDHFLLQLNGHYEGGATGETFNRSGKTDILIRQADRNVFIAECKFWNGAKKFDEAIDQLLGYLTWRDCKCALLVFNRNKDSTAVAEKIHETMQNRKEHRKTIRFAVDTDSQYIFVKSDDPGREVTITTQLFDVPSD